MFQYRKFLLIVIVINTIISWSIFIPAAANVAIIIKGNIVDKTCELDYSNTSMDVQMGRWNKTKEWAKGFVFGRRNISFILHKCGETASFATFKFYGKDSAENSSFFSTGTEVRGIALQLLDSDSKVINNNESVSVRLNSINDNHIIFGVHYIVTSDFIVPGKATSLLNFNVEYP